MKRANGYGVSYNVNKGHNVDFFLMKEEEKKKGSHERRLATINLNADELEMMVEMLVDALLKIKGEEKE